MQSHSSKNNYNGSQNTVNNITAQNRSNQMAVGNNNRQGVLNLTPRTRYVPTNTVFPAVHHGTVMSQINASTYSNRTATLQQCQYAPQYYPHVYYPYFVPQLPPQQQSQNGNGNPLAGLNTIMTVQPSGFVSGPITATNRPTQLAFPVTPVSSVLNVANTNTPPALGLPNLHQTSATLPFVLPTITANNTTSASPSMAVSSLQQNPACLPFSASTAAPHIAQAQVSAAKRTNTIQTKAKIRTHALQIIDPLTKQNILQDLNKEVNKATYITNDSKKANQQPTASKSVEIMQNIETFSSKKKFKDATQQAEQNSIASAMCHNISVKISAIPPNNLSSSKSELLTTTKEMYFQEPMEGVICREREDETKNFKPMTVMGNENSIKEESLVATPLTNECEEKCQSSTEEKSGATKIKSYTNFAEVANEHQPLDNNFVIKDNENENLATNLEELNSNTEINVLENVETKDDGEAFPQTDLETDNNETLYALSSQNDDTSAQITFFNETFKTFGDCGEMQEPPFSPTKRKQYTRKQLMQLRQSKNSCKQPDIKDTCVFAPISSMSGFANRGQKKVIATAFNQKGSSNTPANAQNNVKQYSSNNRNTTSGSVAVSSGRDSRMPSKPIIYLNLSLNRDVQLNKADNAWCPRVLLKNNPQLKEQGEKDELLRRVRGILNKLTPEKFEPLVEEIIKLKIDTFEKMEAVMNLVFEKAIDEPNFSVSYAKLCHRLINEAQLSRDKRMESSTKFHLVYFRNALLHKTESEFTNNVTKINAKEDKLKPIREKLANCQDHNEKIELEALLIEKERKIRRRSGGTVRFIGELFKISILTANIIKSCIEDLLKEPSNEDMLECLCTLLTTVGQKFEQTMCQEEQRNYSLKSVMQRIQNIASKTANTKISSRIRFMLLDVIDLRKKKWQSTRNEAPKTMKQIEKEVNIVQSVSNNSSSTIKRDEQKRQQGGLQNVLSHQPNYTTTTRHPVSDIGKKSTKHNSRSTEKRGDQGRRSNLADHNYIAKNSSGLNKYSDGVKSSNNNNKWQTQTRKANCPPQAVDTSKLIGLTTVDLNNKKMGDASLFQWKKLYTPPTATTSSLQTSNPFGPLALEATTKGTKTDHEPEKTRLNPRQKVPFNKVRNEHGPNRRQNQNATAKEAQRKPSTLQGQQAAIRIQKCGNNEKYQHDITNANLTRPPGKISLLSKSNTTSINSKSMQQPVLFIEPTSADLKLMKSVITEMVENAADSKCIENSTVSCITKLPENLRCYLIYYILTDYLHLGNVKSLTRRYLANIVSYLIEEQFITLEHFYLAYTKFAELASDLIVDIPQLWLYIFEFTGPLLVKHILTINDLWRQEFKNSEIPDFGQKFLKSFIQYSTREVGPNFLRETWKKCHMTWSYFMDEIMVEDFIRRNSFEYVENENYPIPYNHEQKSQEKEFKYVTDRIQQMLSEGTNPDKVIDFINGNIQFINQGFIRSLSSTLTNFAITNLNNYNLDVHCFQSISIPVLRRYLDSKDEYEMACLCAIQTLVHDLDHPKDLLKTIFFELSDADVIAQETFLSWQNLKRQCKKCSIPNL